MGTLKYPEIDKEIYVKAIPKFVGTLKYFKASNKTRKKFNTVWIRFQPVESTLDITEECKEWTHTTSW